MAERKETLPIPFIVPVLMGAAVAVEKGINIGIKSTIEAGLGSFLVSDGFDTMDRTLQFAHQEDKVLYIANGLMGIAKTTLGVLFLESSLNPLFYNTESVGVAEALATIAGAGLAASYLAIKTLHELKKTEIKFQSINIDK